MVHIEATAIMAIHAKVMICSLPEKKSPHFGIRNIMEIRAKINVGSTHVILSSPRRDLDATLIGITMIAIAYEIVASLKLTLIP